LVCWFSGACGYRGFADDTSPAWLGMDALHQTIISTREMCLKCMKSGWEIVGGTLSKKDIAVASKALQHME
jgi:hypothetical protein